MVESIAIDILENYPSINTVGQQKTVDDIMNVPFKDFDESTYLKLNPDVFKAVQNRSFSSGLQHYISYGFYENRSGVPLEVYKAVKEFMEDDKSFPPEHLRKRVHGIEELSSFMNVRAIVSLNIDASINSVIELGEHHRILDFGCGCGRVIRYFHKLSNNSSFYATDIDEEAISWCQDQLSQIGEFVKNKESPPLPFGDEFFDFVNTLTHLLKPTPA